MSHKKTSKPPVYATAASIKKEMDEPRMARSARIMQDNLNSARVADQPSATVPGTVDKIIPASRPGRSEKVQISINRANPRYRDLRIVNSLTDENGDDVKLIKGAHVDVTIAAKPKS
jgi:hypothetical protein